MFSLWCEKVALAIKEKTLKQNMVMSKCLNKFYWWSTIWEFWGIICQFTLFCYPHTDIHIHKWTSVLHPVKKMYIWCLNIFWIDCMWRKPSVRENLIFCFSVTGITTALKLGTLLSTSWNLFKREMFYYYYFCNALSI